MNRIAIIVAFDLHGVMADKKFTTYTRIKQGLTKLKIRKFLVSKSRGRTKLPANTFVGILRGQSLSEKSATAIRGAARRKVSQVITKHHHGRATIFVFVGKRWALAKWTLR